jgi:alkylation response protein AidB-like acyl-CoA dehydrogenase
MDLTWTERDEAFRAEVRAWLRDNVPAAPLPSGDTSAGFAEHVQWEKHLYANRWSVVSWPAEYGGRDADLWQWLIFEEEYYRAGAPQRVTQNGIFLLSPALFAFGTKAQRDALLPRMAAADDLWCQAWSEPGAGSDLAGLTSRAVRDDERGGWVITGQKTWSTRGAFCTHAFGLFRTDPAAGRHRGLTYLLVPLDAAGVTVRGFSRLDGDEGFADLFFDEVFVPDDAVLGEPHRGWHVAMATTGSERGLTLRSPGRFLAAFDRLRELALGRPGGPDAATVERLTECWLDVRAYALYTLDTVTKLTRGEDAGAGSSLNKLHWSQLDVRLHEIARDLLGPEAQADNAWTRGHLFSLSGPIYAGTNEIQRDIVAQRLLGLPRSR